MWRTTVPRGRRLAWLVAAVAVCAVLASTLSLRGLRFSRERAVNELANNGSVSFLSAAWTRHLDFEPFYRTLPMEEAYERVRGMVATDRVEFTDDPLRPLMRDILAKDRGEHLADRWVEEWLWPAAKHQRSGFWNG